MFKVVVAPTIYNNLDAAPGKEWRQDLLYETGDSTRRFEVFGAAFGDTREIASMRAELMVLAINRTTSGLEYDTHSGNDHRKPIDPNSRS